MADEQKREASFYTDLRDQFAAYALSHPFAAVEGRPEKIAQRAYQIADAMIAEKLKR
jgi:hypothetical protein